MENKLYPAKSRGSSDFGWLKANYSFSFANYFNPKRMKFGLLRVLNDDTIAPGKGFGKHPHSAMEIVTIPLKGTLKHADSIGNHGIIEAGEVQIMSAGKGINHSEANASDTEELNLLQIWVFTNAPKIEPRYDQKKFAPKEKHNAWLTVVAPHDAPEGHSLKIHQQAYFNLADLEPEKEITYMTHKKDHGMYIFLISGKIKIASTILSDRDAIGLWDSENITIKAIENSSILLIEIPMN